MTNPKSSSPEAKSLLLTVVLPALCKHAPYVPTEMIRRSLSKAGGKIQAATLNRYLHEFVADELIFDAGRGWYSSLVKVFAMNTTHLKPLIKALGEKFPLLDYSCWSTAQVGSYGHHLLTKFVTFVHTERDAMESVCDFLRGAGYDTHLNPLGKLASQFSIRERTVVLRPNVNTRPTDGHYVLVEGLLVDLFVESRNLQLMDSGEYFQIFRNLTHEARISMARIVDYARQRKPATNELLKSIKDEFSKNHPLVD